MNFIINKEEFLQTVSAWKQIPSRTAVDHIFYNALRGYDIKRGFSPIQDKNKLMCGYKEWQSFDLAKRAALWQIRDYRDMYSNDTVERTERRNLEEKERLGILSKKFGITFTTELNKILRDLLK